MSTPAEALRAVIASQTTVDADSRPMDAEIDDGRVLAMCRAALPIALAQEEAVKALRAALAATVKHVETPADQRDSWWHRTGDRVLAEARAALALATETFRFMPMDEADGHAGVINLADDERLALLAVCIAHQQNAGFKTRLDLRQVPCPDCKSPGFNTGWGYWLHTCGAETGTDGTPMAPCDYPED